MIDNLVNVTLDKWLSSPAVWTTEAPIVSASTKQANEAIIDAFFEDIEATVRSIPRSALDYRKWQTILFEKAIKLERDLLPPGKRRLEHLRELGFFETTGSFIRMARSFDQKLSLATVYQAMRNVWIMNSLQVLMGHKVEVTSAIFAYSMLYPYSDNYLDDKSISNDDKLAFSNKFRIWIEGGRAKAQTARESSILRLIQLIERQYDREDFPAVYSSLLAIHAAQEKSLLQQEASDEDVLVISIEKGGSSVLADTYLVAGQLTPAEEQYAFEYGAFLQFIDDLQDIEEDLEADHQTIFTELEGSILDSLISRLRSFIRQFADSSPFTGPNAEELVSLIYSSINGLITEGIAQNQSRVSPALYDLEERHASTRLAHLKDLRTMAEDSFTSDDLALLTRIIAAE